MGWKALQRRALVAPVVVAAVSVALAATTGSAALASSTSGPLWQSLQAYAGAPAGRAVFDAATCPSAGNCLAAGAVADASLSSGAPLIVASSDGEWGISQTAAVTGGLTSSDYTSVACMSASACVGVGYSEDTSSTQTFEPLAGSIAVAGSTVTPGAASVFQSLPAGDSSSPEEAALVSVSCTATSCTAVGYYKNSGGEEKPLVATYDGYNWSLGSPGGPSTAIGGSNLTAVSCPSDGPCEAVGNYLDSNGDIQSWAVQLSGAETPQLISPPGDASTTSGTLPPFPEGPSGSIAPAMSGISCPSAGACTAVGSYGLSLGLGSMAVPIDNGSVGPVTSLPQPSIPAATLVTGVSCSDATDCTVNGNMITDSGTLVYEPVTGYENAGAWSELEPLQGAGTATTESLLAALACGAPGDCLSTGYNLDSSPYAVTPIFAFSAVTLSVTSSALPAATVGQPYAASLQSNDDFGAGTWSITSGSLPASLTLNASTGAISGTPTAAGTAGFTVQLANVGPLSQTASADLWITVAAAPSTPAAPTATTTMASTSTSTSTTGTASLEVGKVTAKGVSVTLGCAGSGTCRGTAKVTAVEHLTGHKLTAVTARAKKPKKRTVKVTLARQSYSLSAGQVKRVTLKLNGKARSLLTRLHRISGRLTLTPAGASKPTVSRKVTFKSATTKKKKR